MISINNLSRIEVSYSPTPESPGGALAGTVNMVPRSAFERSKPSFSASAYLLMRDNARDFNKVPGPKPSATRNVHPGFDFSYVAPVNKRFGYTISGGYSTNYSPQDNAQTTWRGANAATNGAAFPNTTPDRPYLSQYLIQDAPKVTTRRSFGTSVDYRLTAHDRVTFGFQYSSFDGRFVVSNVTLQHRARAAGRLHAVLHARRRRRRHAHLVASGAKIVSTAPSCRRLSGGTTDRSGNPTSASVTPSRATTTATPTKATSATSPPRALA